MKTTEQILEDVWQQISGMPQPDSFYVNGEWHRVMTAEVKRQELLQQLPTPQGLKRLFPALRG